MFLKKVDNCDVEFFRAIFTEEEVKNAVWSCESSKSLGPDGYTFEFFKANLEMLKGYIMRMMEDFHCNGKIVKGLISSFVVLIPKKLQNQTLKDFRSISLICSFYKIISKVLANRLSKVLDPLISENQSVFLGGRHILDRIVILNEIMDEAKKKKLKRIISKIDFSKAYDSINWDFLEEMLQGMNFCSTWRRWMRECISSASIFVLVNGSPSDDFNLQKGLRQGDSLSSFLFLIVAECLSLIIKKVVNLDVLKLVEIGKDKAHVTHLQYADDTIFVSLGSTENVKAIKHIQ